jgi:hypothetical protein
MWWPLCVYCVLNPTAPARPGGRPLSTGKVRAGEAAGAELVLAELEEIEVSRDARVLQVATSRQAHPPQSH